MITFKLQFFNQVNEKDKQKINSAIRKAQDF